MVEFISEFDTVFPANQFLGVPFCFGIEMQVEIGIFVGYILRLWTRCLGFWVAFRGASIWLCCWHGWARSSRHCEDLMGRGRSVQVTVGVGWMVRKMVDALCGF